jgi:hypothetical protein
MHVTEVISLLEQYNIYIQHKTVFFNLSHYGVSSMHQDSIPIMKINDIEYNGTFIERTVPNWVDYFEFFNNQPIPCIISLIKLIMTGQTITLNFRGI